MDKKIYLTKSGEEELKKEYDVLLKVKRPVVLDRVSQARNMGDLSENAEYTAARDELAFIDGRMDELEELLKRVTIIEDHSRNGSSKIVQLGSMIIVDRNSKKEEFTLVGEWEADPLRKKISYESPLGKALLGKSVGESIEVSAPAGKIIYKIISVH
ncbi:MAG: transcription elongation factor GreA [Candidatus Levybacteria bacterium]|nr:transcription elongation factor GreA [Candidatus Levybacteria bacterium]MSU25688.1 transcription elongation factor GreA [Candidatus Levybacteria bacterium]